MKKLILMVLLAVFLMCGIASAATTMDMSGYVRVFPEMNNFGTTGGAIPPYLLQAAPAGALFKAPPAAQTAAQAAAGTSSGLPAPSVRHYFTDQRTRLFWNVKSNENLGGAVGVEIDSRWGQSSFSNGRSGDGGGLGSDTTNMEVKNAYLWFKEGNLNIRSGIQTYADDMAGIFVGGGDMAGFRADYALSRSSSLTTGVFVWWDPSTAATNGIYFVPLTVKQQLGGGNATLFFYTVQDNSNYVDIANPYTVTAPQSLSYGRRPLTNAVAAVPATAFGTTPVASSAKTTTAYAQAKIYYAGLNYGGKAGNVTYFLMGAYNFGAFEGYMPKNATTGTEAFGDAAISAFALNAKVDVKLGDGKLRFQGLYVSGTESDNTKDPSKYRGFVTGDQYQGANTMPLLQDDLYIILGNPEQISNATFLATDVNNNGDGLRLAYLAYDHNLSPKLNAKVVAGWAGADKENKIYIANGTTQTRKGTELAKEYNAQLRYKWDANLTIAGIASYAYIGDYFKTSAVEADNTYKYLLKFMYAF